LNPLLLKHFADPDFWAAYNRLPDAVRELADKNFALLKSDPAHPSLRLKKIGPLHSVRVGLHYRALATGSSGRVAMVLDRASLRLRSPDFREIERISFTTLKCMG
jgi:hypothetical protein